MDAEHEPEPDDELRREQLRKIARLRVQALEQVGARARGSRPSEQAQPDAPPQAASTPEPTARALGDQHAQAAEAALSAEPPDSLRAVAEAVLALYYETRHQGDDRRPREVPVPALRR